MGRSSKKRRAKKRRQTKQKHNQTTITSTLAKTTKLAKSPSHPASHQNSSTSPPPNSKSKSQKSSKKKNSTSENKSAQLKKESVANPSLSIPNPPLKAQTPSKVTKNLISFSLSHLAFIINKLQSLLLYLTLFLIPTNLAYHFASEEAYVHGILVDYLLPKLYLSDIPIIALLVLWPLQLLIKKHSSKSNSKSKITPLSLGYTIFPLFLLIASLLASASNSSNPIAAYWYLAKLAQLFLFSLYLATTCPALSQITKPLIHASIFQSIIAILQWIQKKSLLGYYFLGESNLRTTSHIAKTALTGEIRPLPYGTTSHPNVLAGFLAITLILTILHHQSFPHKKQKFFSKFFSLILNTCYYLLIISALLLTQSFTAIIALLIGLTLIVFKSFSKPTLFALIGVAVTASLVATTFIDRDSIDRRVQLNSIALDMVQAHPLLGLGPNNFSSRLPDFGTVRAYTRFYQPVHNIYLLWLSETGFLGTITLIIYLAQLTRRQSLSNFSLSIPLIMILIIGLADHYPITIQSGQLLLITSIGLLFTPNTHKQITHKSI